MTFFYRTPTEELISKFTSEEQARIYAPSQRYIENTEVGSNSLFFSYNLKEVQKKFFISNGIELSPFSFKAHSHPACKTLENYFLFSFLPSFISHSGIRELFLFSIKKAKVTRLKNLVDNVQLNHLNRLVEVKDKMRYGMDVSPERIEKRKTGLDIFIHDEIHHWSKSQLISFLEVHRPRNVMATVVFPIEILGGFKSSVLKFLYEFECKNGKLFYYPDGVMSEAYVQTLESSYLFKTNLIKTSKGHYSVSLHRSVGSHHFFQISKYESEILQSHRAFGPYDVLDVGSLFKGKVRVPIEGVSLSHFKKILIYLMSLKKPDVNSAVAKLRQLSNEDVDTNEMWVIRDLAERITHGVSKWSSVGIKTILRDWMVDLCPFKKNFERYHLIDDFDRYLMSIKPLSFSFNCSDDVDYAFEPEEDLPDFIDDFWFGSEKKMIRDPLIKMIEIGRDNQSYSIVPASYQEAAICIFSMNEDCIGWRNRGVRVLLRAKSNIYTILRDEFYSAPLLLECSEPEKLKFTYEDLPFYQFLSEDLEIDGYFLRESVLSSIKGKSLHYSDGFFDPSLFSGPKGTFLGYSEEMDLEASLSALDVLTSKDGEKSDVPILSTEVIEGSNDVDSSDLQLENAVYTSGNEMPPVEFECESEAVEASKEVMIKTWGFSDNNDKDFYCDGVFSLELDFSSILEDLKPLNLRGRKAFFFHSDGLPYFHDSVLYRTFKVPKWLEEIFLVAKGHFNVCFNSCLMQIYEQDGSVGWHFDDEDCYDDDPILTMNFNGTALFEIKNIVSSKLDHKDFILMKSGLQRKEKHRVQHTSEGRISLTLRVQKRPPNFHHGLRFLSKVGCFLQAVSEQVFTQVEDLAIKLGPLYGSMLANWGVSLADMDMFANKLGVRLVVTNGFEVIRAGIEGPEVSMTYLNGHFRSNSNSRMNKGKGIESFPKEFARKTSDEMHSDANPQIIQNLKEVYGVFLNQTVFKLDPKRAQKLLKSLLDGSTGVHCNSSLKEGWKMIPNAKSSEFVMKNYINSNDMWKGSALWNAKVNISGIFGFAGSGKSHGIQKLLNEKFSGSNEILLISPRVLLAEDWRDKVKNLKAMTFESAIKGCLAGYKWIILDEVTLFPNGYLDLLVLKLAHYNELNLKHVTLIGDPLQANYFSERDCNLLGSVKMVDSVFRDVKYQYQSYRIPANVAGRFDVWDKNRHEPIDCHGTFYSDLSSAKLHAKRCDQKIDVVLVASELEKKYFSNQCKCITYGESQGLTFDYGLISLSEESRLCSDNHIYVALTRFKKGFGFFQNFRGDLGTFKSNLGSKLLGRYINLRDNLKPFMMQMLDINLDFMDDRNQIGAGIEMENKMSGDPWLKGLLDLQDVEEVEDLFFEDLSMIEPTGKVHLPLASRNDEFEKIRARESREFKKLDFDWSMQFEDCGVKIKRALNGNLCENFSAVYPVHQACDEMTFLAAVKKRLRFSNPAKNLAKFRGATTAGKVLLKNFLKFIPIPSETFPELLAEAKREFQEVKLKKSEGTIAGNSGRSDPDWSWDKVFLFMKSQQCTKFEKRFCEAKAGQTLACFSHEILCHFSPWCRYMEKVFSRYCPENFYIHQRKDFDKLAEFSKKYCKGNFCIESDYEAFDVSQDHNVLAFEVQLMEHMRIPEGVISDYIRMKTELGCKLGNFAIMRFTGEFCTFLFNTFCNMAFTFMRYQMSGCEPVCFAGDDMCALADLKESSEYNAFFKSFSLKAKVCRTIKPLFCGWRLTKFGLYKEPVLVYERLKIAIEKDKLDLVIDSYFLEFCYAYKLGSWLDWVLDEEQADYQQRLSRFFVKKKHLLKGKSLDYITHCDYLSDGSDEEDCKGFWEDCNRGYSNCGVAFKFYIQ